MFSGGRDKESSSKMALTLRRFKVYLSVSVGDHSLSTYAKFSKNLTLKSVKLYRKIGHFSLRI